MESWFDMHFERGRQQGLAEARIKAKAKLVLHILSVRGVPVDKQSREHILSCTDITTLDQWFDRAIKAMRISDVVGDLGQ